MDTPLISVVIPFRNQGKYLFDALESLHSQTLIPDEIIIVDDASTEKGVKTLFRHVRKQYPRVRIFHQKRRKGPARARNLGAKRAKGEYLLFLDADNMLDPTFLEKTFFLLQKTPSVSFVYTFIQYFGKSQKLWRTMAPYNFYTLLWENQLPSSALIRKKDFAEAGGFDEKLKTFEDEMWDFWIRMGKMGLYGYPLTEPLLRIRKAENKRSRHIQKYKRKGVDLLRRRHRSLYYFWNVWSFWFEWRSAKWREPKISSIKHPARSAKFFRGFRASCHEAEIDRLVHWEKSPLACMQLLLPISFREKCNQFFGRNIFSEYVRFSQFSDEQESTCFERFHRSLRQTPAKPFKNKMSVVVFLPWLPVGGTEKFLLTLFRNLSADFEFTVFLTEKDASVAHHEFAQYSHIYHLNHLFQRQDDQEQFILQKIGVLEPESIFLLESAFAFRMLPRIKSHFPSLSVCTTLHGGNEAKIFSLAGMYLPFLDSVVCSSESVQKRFEKVLEESLTESQFQQNRRHKLKMVRNTIDFFHLEQQERDKNIPTKMKKDHPYQKNIVFIGRYDEEKNPALLLRIARFMALDLDLDHYRFFLFGEGPLRKSLSREAKILNDEVGFPLVVVGKKQENTASIFARADLCLNPAPDEKFSFSVLESIFFGVGVCGFDLEIFQELLPSKHFFGVPKDTGNEIESFVRQIFSATRERINADEQFRMREFVRSNFSIYPFLEQYRRVFLSRALYRQMSLIVEDPEREDERGRKKEIEGVRGLGS